MNRYVWQWTLQSQWWRDNQKYLEHISAGEGVSRHTLTRECVHVCARLQLRSWGTENVCIGNDCTHNKHTSIGKGVRYGTL